jgi:hypothetical protein
MRRNGVTHLPFQCKAQPFIWVDWKLAKSISAECLTPLNRLSGEYLDGSIGFGISQPYHAINN